MEPLGLAYRPAIRVAMPWANDALLIGDANVQATCDTVFREIADARERLLAELRAMAAACAK